MSRVRKKKKKPRHELNIVYTCREGKRGVVIFSLVMSTIWSISDDRIYYETTEFEQFLDIFKDPLDIGAWCDKGKTYISLGRFEEAVEHFNCALEQCVGSPLKFVDDVQLWDDKATALIALGRYAEAIDCYAHILDEECNVDYWCHKVTESQELGETSQTKWCTIQALSMVRRIPMYWTLKGDLYLKLNKIYQARDCYDRAKSLLTTNGLKWIRSDEFRRLIHNEGERYMEPMCPLVWSDKADELVSIGRIDEALTLYNHVIDMKPSEVHKHYWLLRKAKVLIQCERIDDAMEIFDEIIAASNSYYVKTQRKELLRKHLDAIVRSKIRQQQREETSLVSATSRLAITDDDIF